MYLFASEKALAEELHQSQQLDIKRCVTSIVRITLAFRCDPHHITVCMGATLSVAENQDALR